MAVPRCRVAGAEVSEAGLRIVAAAHPGGRAPGLPQVARPGLVGGAADAVLGLVAGGVELVAHVAFHHRACPHQLAGLRIARIDTADNAELAAGDAGQQQALGDDRRGGVGVAGGVIIELFLPHHLAGVLVQRHHLCVQGGENHQVVEHGSAAVDHVAAGHDAVGQAMLVLPQLGAGLGVEREQARVRTGNEHLAAHHHRLRLLAALLFAAEGERPGRHQTLDVLRVDLRQRAVALAFRAEAPRQHVTGRLGVVLDICGRDARMDLPADCERSAEQCGDDGFFHLQASFGSNEL